MRGCSLSFSILSRYFYIQFPTLPVPALLFSFMIINSYVIKICFNYSALIKAQSILYPSDTVLCGHLIAKSPKIYFPYLFIVNNTLYKVDTSIKNIKSLVKFRVSLCV